MQSGGGVTCSGGEPLAQPRFLRTLLRELHENIGLNTCIETSCHAPWAHLEAILPYLDEIYADIKHMDSAAHKDGTGQANDLILDNIKKLATCGKHVVIRVPLIPDFNDTTENLAALAGFMRENGLPEVEFMPLHVYGRSKYEALGRVFRVSAVRKPRCDEALLVAGAHGLGATILRR